jgi:hypothetical protein
MNEGESAWHAYAVGGFHPARKEACIWGLEMCNSDIPIDAKVAPGIQNYARAGQTAKCQSQKQHKQISTMTKNHRKGTEPCWVRHNVVKK